VVVKSEVKCHQTWKRQLHHRLESLTGDNSAEDRDLGNDVPQKLEQNVKNCTNYSVNGGMFDPLMA